MFAAVAGGGDSQRLFEDLCKIIHVQNAHFLGHGGNGVVVLHQQLGRAVDTLGVDIIDQGAAGLLLEQCRQVQMCIRDRLWRCVEPCEFPFMPRAPLLGATVTTAASGG